MSLKLQYLRGGKRLKFKKEWLNVVLPTLRANPDVYDSTFHHTMLVFSSPPWDLQGQWTYEIEANAKAEPSKHFFMEVKTKDNLHFAKGLFGHLKKDAH